MKQHTNKESSATRQTECLKEPMLFQDLGKRKVVVDFSGHLLSSDGGVLLLGQIDSGMGISRTIAGAFQDDRDPDLIEHSVDELLRQRIFGLAFRRTRTKYVQDNWHKLGLRKNLTSSLLKNYRRPRPFWLTPSWIA